MTKEKLNQILENHKHWLDKDVDGWEDMKADLHGADLRNVDLHNVDLARADLHEANLCYVNLNRVNLHGANLSGVDLHEANLRFANLSKANLSGANLHDADLSYSSLYYANLSSADLLGTKLRYSDLCHTNLSGANLHEADLCHADLRYAILSNNDLSGVNLHGTNLFGDLIEYRKGKIVTEDILGYKKCIGDIIVTLRIPRGAIVFSINGNQCRTNKVKVVGIDGADRAYSQYNWGSYYVGDEINVYNFNCEYNNLCVEGIHFFLTKEEAEEY